MRVPSGFPGHPSSPRRSCGDAWMRRRLIRASMRPKERRVSPRWGLCEQKVGWPREAKGRDVAAFGDETWVCARRRDPMGCCGACGGVEATRDEKHANGGSFSCVERTRSGGRAAERQTLWEAAGARVGLAKKKRGHRRCLRGVWGRSGRSERQSRPPAAGGGRQVVCVTAAWEGWGGWHQLKGIDFNA